MEANAGNREITIWGAGKIGRGFIADLFFQNGFQVTFIDKNADLINRLREAWSYKVYNFPNKKEPQINKIEDYNAFSTSEKEHVQEVFNNTSLLALSVFPNSFQEVVNEFKNLLIRRIEVNKEKPLDILLCTNSIGIGKKFKNQLINVLEPHLAEYAKSKLGTVECLLMRIVIDSPEGETISNTLDLTTNGFSYLVMDKLGFKGKLPKGNNFRFSDRIEAEEFRKIYTYNMVHAVFAYGGYQKKYDYVNQATQDPELYELAERSLEEAAFGLQHEFGFSEEEMTQYNQEVMINMTNPILKDSIFRVAFDPVRKLGRDERLIGPALLCRKYGQMPYFLGVTIFNALQYHHPNDPSSMEVQKMIEDIGLKAAFEKLASIDQEKELTGLMLLIKSHTENKKVQDTELILFLKKAYQLGFHYEKKYRGCAQCLLGAMYELTGKTDDSIFRAASAFSGGMSLCGDGVCGGYTGGLMFMGIFAGRRLEFISADKEEQYKAYELSQLMHDKYMETYGTVTCKEIHKEIFGQAFILRTKEVRNQFEDAGAHRDKCTSVIGMAAVWLTDIMVERGLLNHLLLKYNKDSDVS